MCLAQLNDFYLIEDGVEGTVLVPFIDSQADVIVDMATLTGAQAHMTGKHHAAVLTNCELFEEKVRYRVR